MTQVKSTTIRNIVQNHLEITTWRPSNTRKPVGFDNQTRKFVYDGTRRARFYVLPSDRNNVAGLRDALNAIVKVLECRLYQTWVFGKTKRRGGTRVWRLEVIYTPQ